MKAIEYDSKLKSFKVKLFASQYDLDVLSSFVQQLVNRITGEVTDLIDYDEDIDLEVYSGNIKLGTYKLSNNKLYYVEINPTLFDWKYLSIKIVVNAGTSTSNIIKAIASIFNKRYRSNQKSITLDYNDIKLYQTNRAGSGNKSIKYNKVTKSVSIKDHNLM